MFSAFNSLANPCDAVIVTPSPILCDRFLRFFAEKISVLRSLLTSSSDLDPHIVSMCPAVLDHFEPISLAALQEVVHHLRPTNCPSDNIPSRLLKEVFDTVGTSILSLINTCLVSGCVPAHFKHAVVEPLLKNKNLNPTVLSNFRPISKLPFLSKVLEKVVLSQLQDFLDQHGIHEKFQSGFKQLHSTETALLKIFNDLILAVDSGHSAVLVLLDLTAAFDTVDHNILLSRLESYVGIRGSALKWFNSYLTDRTFSIRLGDYSSGHAPLVCGVPQGSVLGPTLFSLYMLPLGSIFKKHNVSFHCFADDVQIYMPVKIKSKGALQPLLDCLNEVKLWLSSNFLKLNESKTEFIVFGSPLSLGDEPILGPISSNTRNSVKSLGVHLDNSFKFRKQISSVVSSSFFQLRLISKIKAYIPPGDLEKVVHAFITNRLDYCNALYVGLDQSSIQRLQLVQNAAARLLTSTRKTEHITPVLRSLHWLPVCQRINFKILLLTFKAMNGLAPLYLSDLLVPHTLSRTSRSADQFLLSTPKSRLKTRGDRAFAVAAPKLWNSLPFPIRTAPNLVHFKSLLKTHLFSRAFNP